MKSASTQTLSAIANQLRIHCITATTAAGSGHVTSCCSAAEIVATLFFGTMRFDAKNPLDPNNDRFVLSKGHAAPLLYAAWVEAGFLPATELQNLRKIDSDLEGHPTPRLPFVDVATGSLGQGLSCGAGMALCARMDGLDYRTFVLLGDGECAEGSVWEAASFAAKRRLTNLVAIVDVNRLGQSGETAFGHDLEVYRRRFEAFGWRAVSIDGHDVGAILSALETIERDDRPLAIIARTIKGKGLEVADKENWHGKPLPQAEAEKAVAALRPHAQSAGPDPVEHPQRVPLLIVTPPEKFPPFQYKKGDKVATREAYGSALARIGQKETRVVALDGDVRNSTYSEKFMQRFPERFVECYIAEQNMVGVAAGMASRGKMPFVSTFACFLTRAFDQIRMAAISQLNLKLCGSHAGVSIGEDGPSQMGLEDLAMMRALPGSVVLCPCDAVSTERLVEEMAHHRGICYLRTARPKTPVIYDNNEDFPVGGAKILRQSDEDQITVIATGVTVFEALEAADSSDLKMTVVDAYSIKPLATELLLEAAERTNRLVLTVEDHYAQGGLGEAVAAKLSREGVMVEHLAVTELPHSGKGPELMARYGIDAHAIVEKAHALVSHLENRAEEHLLAR